MKISVITVSYNSSATLRDTLQSVASQTHPDIEHILVDGGSTDITSNLVNQYGKHLAKFVSEPDQGIYDAMNKGLALATGDIVGFINSDDLFFESDSLAKIASAFSDPNIDAVYGDIVMVDPLKLQIIHRYWRPGLFKKGAFSHGWMVPHPTLYVRRDILIASGGFNVSYRLQADFDLELRLFELMNIRSRYLPNTIVRMRMGGATTGSLSNIFRGNIEAANSAKSHGFHGGIQFIANKIIRRLPQYWKRPS